MLADLRRSALAALLAAASALAQIDIPLDHPAIGYSSRPLTDPVSELDRGIRAGSIQLQFDDQLGYLPSVLAALHIPVQSQILVFSKTGVQQMRIEPQHPRMLYFNDSVVVGWVKNGFMELASQDPRQGVVFFRLDQRDSTYRERAANRTGPPESPLSRRLDCVNCHRSDSTRGVPGTLIRSVFPSPDGAPLPQLGQQDTDSRTPFEKLWGGWYVTGRSGGARHLGNAVVTDAARPEAMVTAETLNLESLAGKVDTTHWLSPYSDVVALMVFEHQMHMMNLLTRIGWETRVALYDRSAAARRLQDAARELVDYLLFVDEAPLPTRLESTSGFDREFASRGPFDRQNRSLRQLDLERRLLRYPCSYMVYSAVFDALPGEAKRAVYSRMWRVLSGEEKSPRYARLPLHQRRAIVEILRDTKPDLPSYFQAVQR